MRPVPKIYKMHFGFGEDYPPELKSLTKDGKHHGFDYLTPSGTLGSAGVDGVLNHIGFLRGYGLAVIVKFWTGSLWWKKQYRVIMAHLSYILTLKRVGEKVKKTENLYITGDSGTAKGHPHLHVEVQEYTEVGWVAIDPSFAVGDA